MKPRDLKRFVKFLQKFLENRYEGNIVCATEALEEAHKEYACEWDTEWEIYELDKTSLLREFELADIHYDEEHDILI